MIIYKVPTRMHPSCGDEHTGYAWCLTKTDAKRIFKSDNADPKRGDEIRACELAMNKHDIIRFLNTHASHPDNG